MRSWRLPINTVGKWRAMLRAFFHEGAPQAQALYPVTSDADVQAALDQFIGDPFLAGARRAVRLSWAVQSQVVQPPGPRHPARGARRLHERAAGGGFAGWERG